MSTLIKREIRSVIKVKGRLLETVNEKYLRSDITCLSSLCDKCVINKKCTLLPKDTTHYLIPFMDVVFKYMDVLEFPEIRGIIFAQTVTQKMQSDYGRSLVNKFKKIWKDLRKESVVFLNEISIDTYSERLDSETVTAWHARNIYNIGQWFFCHLDGKMPIVLITEDKQIISTYENEVAGIFVISLNDYLLQFLPNLTIAYDIYESLTALHNMEPIKELYGGFRDYLSADILESGLKNGIYHEGRLKVDKHHPQDEALVVCSSVGMDKTGHDEVLISTLKDRNRAVHNDSVYVEILPKSLWKGKLKHLGTFQKSDEKLKQGHAEVMPTGKIVGIKQRNWRDYVACLPQTEDFSKSQGQDRILVIPFDYRIPKIRIATRQAATLEGDRIVVRIDCWNLNSQYPDGHFLRSLGKIGNTETESMTLLVENRISIFPFPARVNDEMPSCTGRENLDATGRKDLRNSHLICSIDPKGCEDVDDALSIRVLSEDLIELGVHIADVTNYVLPNSCTDLEARARATSVYLAERRYDMLPLVLSSNLCSLLSNVDRFAVSILWTLDKNGQIKDVWFGRTVIRSSYKLFYELAQEIIYGEAFQMFTEQCPEVADCSEQEIKERFHQLRDALIKLADVANTIKRRRLAAGALELENTEVLFEFEEMDKSRISSMKTKQSLEIHETVAECMIFANNWVAQRIYQTFPTKSLLRRHPEARQDQFEYLCLLAQVKGFNFLTASNKEVADSLNMCVDPNDPFVNMLMRSLVIHTMRPASYISTGSYNPDEYYHYGLALSYYTHFTSPIRRYADILVHRLLLAITDSDFDGPGILENGVLQDVCDHINEKHTSAKVVQRQSRELFQTLYFDSLPLEDSNRVTDAIIYAIRSNGVLVFVPQFGIKGPVYLVDKQQQVAFVMKSDQIDWIPGEIEFHKQFISVIPSNGHVQKYLLFDHITVRVVVIQNGVHAPSIKLDLVSNHISTSLSETIIPRVEKQLSQKTQEKTDASKIDDVCCNTNSDFHSSKKSLYNIIENLRSLALTDQR
ncbi:DIS3 mitotic control [Chamberlinius hualienensis]